MLLLCFVCLFVCLFVAVIVCHLPLVGPCKLIALNGRMYKQFNGEELKGRDMIKVYCFYTFRYKKDYVEEEQGEEIFETLIRSWPNGKEQ